MSAVLKTQQMDWSKYTIDGWLEQFGAWCETVRMKGGFARWASYQSNLLVDA